MKGNVRPLGDRVMLRLHPPKSQKGRIVIPETVNGNATDMRKATVVDIGPDAGNEIDVGQTVLVPLGAGIDVEFEDDVKPSGKHKIIRAVDIMAVLWES